MGNFLKNLITGLAGFVHQAIPMQIKLGWTYYTPLTGYTKKMKITVERNRKTEDGIIGQMFLDWHSFTCYTVENLLNEIPAGEYDLEFTFSPKFGRTMPLINVPGRAGIRIHWANYPEQLDGCIAVGNKEERDAVDNSLATFSKLWTILNQQQGIRILIVDPPLAA